MAQFLIAGAGIAGLSSAIALGRLGHSVRVLEQAPELSEVGAGIQLGPNAMRILQSWRLDDAILQKGYQPAQLQVRDARNDRILTARPLNDANDACARYGAPHVTIRRADLQSVLLQAAQDAGGAVLLGRVVDASHAAQADALLACDGVHSRWCAGAPVHSGYIAHRAMIEMAQLPMALRSQSVQVWMGEAQHVVAYPVNNTQMNVVMVQASGLFVRSPMSSQLRTLIEAIKANGGFTQWPLLIRPPLLYAKAYVQGNVALLGDAAHSMYPYLAQGAAMAIEDAQALGFACADLPDTSPAFIHKALLHYAQMRWRRNAHVQMRSQLQGHAVHATQVVRVLRNFVLQAAGKQVTSMRWLYDYSNTPITTNHIRTSQ